jgi:membrane protein DedA with SNARE-associated domain
MINLESLISAYGYPALLVGTFFEGETILIIAGFLAHRGYLELPWVIVFAFLGTFSGDQLYFWLGRTKGAKFLVRRPFYRARVEKAQNLLEKHRKLIILGFRFVYGLRTVTPFAIGLSKVEAKQFIVLNATGATVWAMMVGSGGYLFGNALEIIIGDIKHYELEILAAMILAGCVVWLVYFYRRRRTSHFAMKNM